MKLFKYLCHLNLFKNVDDNEYQNRSNIVATRIYIITFLFVLISIIVTLWLTVEIKSITINNPTQEQFHTFPHDSQCPCSQLSLSYGTFVTLNEKFHQVCSSDFVSDRWIQMLFTGSNTSNFYQSDIRLMGSSSFQVLASLCHLAKKRVQADLNSLYASQFISTNILYDNLLQLTVEASILEFKLTMSFLFQSQLHLINQMMFANQLMPARETTFHLYFYDQLYAESTTLSIIERVFLGANNSYCLCSGNYSCSEQSGIYSINITNNSLTKSSIVSLMTIPGFLAGCTSIHSLMQSTLECFYDQLCLNTILSYITNEDNFTAMSEFELTHFQTNSTIQTIVDQMMLEDLTYNISYEKYFAQCKPLTCTYMNMKRRDFVYILTKIIGLLGGLTIVLGLLIPLIVRYIRNRRLQNESTRKTSLRIKFIEYKSRMSHIFKELNIFKTNSNNNCYTNYERQITRIFILLLITSFTTIIIYLLSTEDIYRKSIVNPNETTYMKLKQQYHDYVSCPCTQLSTSYEKFLSITPIYHEICSSDFISSEWMDFLALFTSYTMVADLRYEINLLAQFNILNTFCMSTAQTIEDARRIFLQNQYVTSEIIDEDIFRNHISSLIDNWKANIQNQYVRLIDFIRETNQGNKLINYLHNIDFKLNLTTKEMHYKSLNYSNCSCDLFSSCTMPIVNALPRRLSFGYSPSSLNIPNFFIGCFPTEALFQSTLECFANQTCLNNMIEYIYAIYFDYVVPKNFIILNITDQQQNETIETIINRLMVNSWIENISFSSYYNSCAPVCTYEYKSYRRLIVVLSTVIGVFGGLAKGLKLLISIIIICIEDLVTINSFASVTQLMKCIFYVNNDQTRMNRLHFLFLLITLIILYLVSYLSIQTKTIEINQPSLSIYEDLVRQYPEKLECSCSKISIEYETFFRIKPRFHQLCSSDFISNDWIVYIYKNNNQSISEDSQKILLGQYQLLASFCQLSKETVENAILQLATTDYINMKLIPINRFYEQVYKIKDDFELRTVQSFINILDLIREMTANNLLMTMHSTNWKHTSIQRTARYWDYQTISMKYNQCDCGLSPKCIHSYRNMTFGCYSLETLLQSTLQCFYNQECIDSMQYFQALNFSTNKSQFDINSTVEFILEKLFIEEYYLDISYDNYFNQCAVSSCSYSLYGNGNPIDTAVMLIELFGGLSIISHWLIIGIVRFHQYLKQRQIKLEMS